MGFLKSINSSRMRVGLPVQILVVFCVVENSWKSIGIAADASLRVNFDAT